MNELERAWRWRESFNLIQENQAIRVFHGPGEGSDAKRSFAVDRFGQHYWITEWEESKLKREKLEQIREELVRFCKEKGALSVVGLARPTAGVAPEAEAWFGNPPLSRFEVSEGGMKFGIQLMNTRHPGLFLDHAPLRVWLKNSVQNLRVLNTFAYTGSLSVAAGVGGAQQVTTLDLSKNFLEWAKENWERNGLKSSSARFIFGDVFEWLPRLKREQAEYDCIILDPPSFSRGKKGNFSTAKDLQKLHALAFDLLAPNGILITSINSANITWNKYESDLMAAAHSQHLKLAVLKQIDLPETFPTPLGPGGYRYLKGWILRRLG